MDGTAKKDVVERLLEESMVLITIDARNDNVDVPGNLMGDPQLRLNLSHRFGLPMELDEWGVHATLTFGGHPYDCHIPWDTIYMVVSHATGQPFVFPSDVPTGVVGPSAPMPEPEPQKPALRLIPGEGEAEEAPAAIPATAENETPAGEDTPPEEPPPKNRGHLRVVK